MNVSYSLILFVILCGFCNSVFAQPNEDPDEFPGIPGSHQNESSCSYRGQQGFYRRRSECDKPSRHICRSGVDPIICCLDEHEPKTTTTEMDLSFPNCGFRRPKIKGSSRQSSTTRPANNTGEKRGEEHLIGGGKEAERNTWPWMVAVGIGASPQTPGQVFCGGSLISQKYVLSAAHCFNMEKGSIDPTKFFVLVGSHTLPDGTEYRVKKVLIHPDYKSPLAYNDICLLEIKNKIELSKKVYPVCLPSKGRRVQRNTPVTVTGWGDTFAGGKSQTLQEITIPIVPLNECKATYSHNSYLKEQVDLPRGITKNLICAGGKEGKSVCKGDSGGPLVSKLKDNSYVQLGVVSFGSTCSPVGPPGVYTRVSKYTKWIYENTDLGKV